MLRRAWHRGKPTMRRRRSPSRQRWPIVRVRGASVAAGTVNRAAATSATTATARRAIGVLPLVLANEASLEGDVQGQRVRAADHRKSTTGRSLQHDHQRHGERSGTERDDREGRVRPQRHRGGVPGRDRQAVDGVVGHSPEGLAAARTPATPRHTREAPARCVAAWRRARHSTRSTSASPEAEDT